MRSVRISLKTARVLLSAVDLRGLGATTVDLAMAAEALRKAIEPKRSVVANRKRRTAKKSTKREETAAIREAVMRRANGRCEVCCALDLRLAPLQLDHFFGRVRVKQSVKNCWALCGPCHRMKTENDPSAADWLKWFIVHATRYGHHDEARLAQNRLEAIELSRGEVRP